MSAPASFAAATAVAVSLLFTGVPAAFAADLWEPPRGGAAYDDESRFGDSYRYGDRYGYGEDYDRGAPPPEDRYAGHPEDFGPPPIPPAGLKDDRFRDREFYPSSDRRYGEGCVPRYVLRDRLRAAGWYDFQGMDRRDGVLLTEARSPTGRPFALTIDRCSGEVVDARPLDGGRSYAYGGHRRWTPSY
jgi:hypothetical protein